MSELEDMTTFVFTWHALSDACPKCRSLNMKEYHNQNIYQNVLWDEFYGNIWDLDRDHSLAHGIRQYNCRCQLTVRTEIDWNKWRELQELSETIIRFGKPVTVYRSPETGRFIKGV